MRAIDADTLRERLQNLAYDDWNQGITTSFADACNEIIEVIEEQPTYEPSAQPEQRWIPCSERLPEDYEEVLVWFEYFRYGNYNRLYQTYGIGDYSSEYDSWMINHESGWRKLRVFAWMPLPEPYEEENDD